MDRASHPFAQQSPPAGRVSVARGGGAWALRPRDAVYRMLKRRILLNELPPGAPLTELGVAEAMACSQGTVREALLRLQDDGLVMRAGRRTAVTPLDAELAGEMLALRRQIETRAALRVPARMTAEVLAELHDIQAEMDRCAAGQDAFGLIEQDIRFHLTLFAASGFQALEQILTRLMLHTHRQKLWEPRHSRSLGQTAARHRDILAAIAQGGPALADALGRHIDTIVEVAPAFPDPSEG